MSHPVLAQSLLIQRLEWAPVRLPLSRPLKTSRGVISEREVLLLRATLEVEGREVVGFGEAAPLAGFCVETVEDCQRWLELFDGEVLLADVQSLDGELAGLAGLPSLRFGLELALLDGLSRAADKPLREVLAKEQAPARDRVELQWTVGDGEANETVERCLEGAQQGFSAFKLKVGCAGLFEDIARVRAVRDALPGATLRLDANGAWTPDQALAFAREVQASGIDFIEDPLPAKEQAALIELAGQSPVAIAADESGLPLSNARRLVGKSLVPVLVVKPMALGGLLPTARLVEEAQRKGVRVVVSSLIESALGRRAIGHLAAAQPWLAGPQGLGTGAWLQSDVTGPDRIAEGALLLEDGAGLGFEPAGRAT